AQGGRLQSADGNSTFINRIRCAVLPGSAECVRHAGAHARAANAETMRAGRSQREEQKHDHGNQEGAPSERDAEIEMVAQHRGSVGLAHSGPLMQVKGYCVILPRIRWPSFRAVERSTKP